MTSYLPKLALILIGALCLIGCSQRPLSVGSGGTLIVIADELDRSIIEKAIGLKFGHIIETPQPEPQFNIIWTDGDKLSDHTRNPLMLLAAPLDGVGPTADLLQRMLTSETRAGVESGDFAVFKKNDPWAMRQLLLIMVGRDRVELGKRMQEWIDSLYYWALDFEYDRLAKELTRRNNAREFNYSFDEQSGFRFDQQVDYIETLNIDSLRLIRFIRHYPERWLMISWGETMNGRLPDPVALYEHRKSLGNFFIDPVLTYDDHYQWREVSFNGLECILINGIWATIGSTGGGPFFSYCIEIPESNRYCIIDGAVFAPGESKMPYLWQLDAMAHTFSLTSQ